jgi:Uma2 family endonuclease
MVTTAPHPTFPSTLEEFENWKPNDGSKYEWNDGKIIKFEQMKRKHLKIIKILNRLFLTTAAHQQGGELICEQDVMLSAIQLRRPDMAYFTDEQINADGDDEPIPSFCIEVVSTHDQYNDLKNKLKEYFRHGVQVVWVIMPDEEVVEVYTSFKSVKVCTDSDICSAAPVIEDFQISVDELLR